MVRKKVLVITQYFWPEEFRVNELVRKLTSMGYDVDVLTGRPNYPDGFIYNEFESNPERFSAYSNANIFRVKNRPRGKRKLSLFINYLSFSVRATFYLLTHFRKKDYSAIFAVQLSPIFSVIPAIIYGRFKKIKVTIWILDLWPDILSALNLVSNKFIIKILEIISSLIYRSFDTLLISSQGFRTRLVDLGVTNNSIHYFPQWIEDTMINGLDISTTKEYEKVEPLLRKYKNLNKIVFTGNIGECQDFPSVIKAVKILEDRNDFVIIIIGSGREEKNIKKLIADNGLENKIVLLGRFPIEFMPSFYKMADALLLPLAKDPLFEITLPGKTQSYLYAGRPIIGMLSGEGAMTLKASKSSFICDSGDYKSLSNLIDRFCSTSLSDKISMGRNAKSYAEENFLLETTIIRFLEVCNLK